MDRLYCVGSHLAERIARMEFADLKMAITADQLRVEQSVTQLDAVYTQLKLIPAFDYCTLTVALVEHAFTHINFRTEQRELRDFSLICYLKKPGGTRV